MNIDEAAELGAKLTVARAARIEQAKESRGHLRMLAFLMRQEAAALREFAKSGSMELSGSCEIDACGLLNQARTLDVIIPPDPATEAP